MPAGGCFLIAFIAIGGGIIAGALWGVVGVLVFLAALVLLIVILSWMYN